MSDCKRSDIAPFEHDPKPGRTSLTLHSAHVPSTQTHVDEARLLRKIDLRVVPMLFLVYLVAFLDRVNISNALTLGLPAELGLVGDQRNIALTIFFAPYIIFEIPSNIIMKRLSPRVWLSGCIIGFGIIMLGQGFVQSYRGLLATRFFLGLTEAGIFPGSFYLISFWYKKEEAQKRFTLYWSSTIFAGAFGGLLASAIANINVGPSSWRWIFILEGIATILVGIIAIFGITNFPKEAKWLSPAERDFILQKTGANESHMVFVTGKDVLAFFKQPKHWLAAIMYFSLLVPAYSIVYFLPTIVQSLGYGNIQTQLHAVPPFAAAFGFAVVLAFLSDKLRIRSPFIFLGLALLIVGLAVLISIQGVTHFSVEYAGLCFVAMGSFGIGGNMVCWYIMNLQGHVERSIGSAWMICFGNIGGIVATFLFLKKDAPYYHSGYSTCLSLSALCVVSCVGYGYSIWREKRQLDCDKEVTGSKEQLLFL